MSNASSGAPSAPRNPSPTSVDAHIVKLVAAVLASAVGGCGGQATTTRGADATHTTNPVGTSATPTATASEVAVPISSTPPTSFPQGDPRAICATYRDKVASDPTGPKLRATTEETSRRARKLDVDGSFMQGGMVQCEIVWERFASSRLILVTPTCCPQAMDMLPCPPASLQPFATERSKLETVVLDLDGRVVSESLAWAVWADMPQMHACGRRPEGFVATPTVAETSEGACLAEMAELEAASIGAFDRLARELSALGAPSSLVDRARSARLDEIRHARVVRALARDRGVMPRPVRARRRTVRPALEVALENAVEGCVFETFGAAVATFQAERAADPSVREAFDRIAIDERAHASLAWDVDAFLASVLDDEGRAAVARAKHEARDRLLRSRPTSGCDALGMPAEREHRALAAAVAALA